jgi:cyanophycin synthetase
VELASDKEETNKILANARPAGAAPGTGAKRRSGAVRAARRMGYPVVTKPYNGNHGRGISINLKTSDEEVRAGFNKARRASRAR